MFKHNFFLFFLVSIFLAGIVVILTFRPQKKIKGYNDFENFDSTIAPTVIPTTTSAQNNNCPDMLIQNGKFLFLYNSKQPVVNGTNPMSFNNLDEYINYYNSQKQNGNNCPLLYAVKENNAQGEDVYRVRPSPFDLQGGLPVATGSIPSGNDGTLVLPDFDTNSYAGFDAHNQDIGVYTNLDKIHDSTQNQPLSDNPMDPNWGGKEYTNQMIDSGKYDDYNISRPMLFNPKSVMFNPNLSNGVGPPKDIL